MPPKHVLDRNNEHINDRETNNVGENESFNITEFGLKPYLIECAP